MDKFLEQVLGTTDLGTYLAAYIFAGIGVLISLRIKANSRDKLSDNTPYNFSWRFLIQDNLLQITSNIGLLFLAFRFTNEFYGQELSMKLAVFMGAGIDSLIELFKILQNKARK